MLARWPCPASLSQDTGASEMAAAFDRGRSVRLLIVPALFDEGNRLRRFTVQAMRALDAAGVDCLLPDLPGTNESLAPLPDQSLDSWRSAMSAAADWFNASHVLAIRGGGLVAPDRPGWSYAPVSGASLLRQMIRVRLLQSREAGREENHESLLSAGREHGLNLAGYPLGAAMIGQLGAAATAPQLAPISQGDIGGGPGLWLRAEPDENPSQSTGLARFVMQGLRE